MTAKILTSYWAKPIPVRNRDWSATYDDYDGAEDSSNRGEIGLGATEQEAIDDLTENHPRGVAVHVREDADRMRLALELIASLQVGPETCAVELLCSVVATAKAALGEPVSGSGLDSLGERS